MRSRRALRRPAEVQGCPLTALHCKDSASFRAPKSLRPSRQLVEDFAAYFFGVFLPSTRRPFSGMGRPSARRRKAAPATTPLKRESPELSLRAFQRLSRNVRRL